MSRSTTHRPRGRNDEPGDDTRTRMFRRWCARARVRRRIQTILATGAIAVLAVIGVGHGAAVAATPAAGYGSDAPAASPPCCSVPWQYPLMYLTDLGRGTLTPFQPAVGPLTPLKAAGLGAADLVITPDAKTAYITHLPFGDSDNKFVVAVDLDTGGRLAEAPVGCTSTGIAINRAGTTVYVTCKNGNLVAIDTATNKAGKPIALGGTSRAVALLPNGDTAFVVNDNEVIPVDTRTGVATAPIPVASTPNAIQVIPDGKTLYVTSSDGHVTPIGTSTNKAGKPIAVDGDAHGVAIGPGGRTAWVLAGDTAVPIDTATNKPGTSIAVGRDSLRITIGIGDAYVTHGTDGDIFNIADIDTGRRQIVNPTEVNVQPTGIAVAPDQAPVARLKVTPAPAGKATTFDPFGSTTRFTYVENYRWSFGDGTTATTYGDPYGGPNPQDGLPTHVYAKPGTYTVTMTAVDLLDTSTTSAFTGQMTVRNGGLSAQTTTQVVITP